MKAKQQTILQTLPIFNPHSDWRVDYLDPDAGEWWEWGTFGSFKLANDVAIKLNKARNCAVKVLEVPARY